MNYVQIMSMYVCVCVREPLRTVNVHSRAYSEHIVISYAPAESPGCS